MKTVGKIPGCCILSEKKQRTSDVDEEIEKTQRALKEERRGRKTLTFNPDDDVIEFERTRFDSYVGSGTDGDDDPPKSSVNRF